MNQPALRVIRGEPTPEELAALTALVSVAAVTGADVESEPSRRGRWNDPAAMHRGALPSGPGGWRAASR